MSKPKLLEINVSFSAGGKVAILDYGNITSDYHVSQSRKWAIPDDWTEEQAEGFLAEKYVEIRDRVDTLATREFDERFDQSYLNK